MLSRSELRRNENAVRGGYVFGPKQRVQLSPTSDCTGEQAAPFTRGREHLRAAVPRAGAPHIGQAEQKRACDAPSDLPPRHAGQLRKLKDDVGVGRGGRGGAGRKPQDRRRCHAAPPWGRRSQPRGGGGNRQQRLFRGRGQHPKAGYLKTRLKSEDITINIGKDNVVPKCSIPGHAWKNVVHNDMVTWLAYYKDPELSFSNVKYVYLAASSKFKGLSDKLKYEKSRKLKSYIDGIRTDYLNKIKSESKIEKELGTALYLIDKLALRVGNEKSEEEADTVGCCSLRVEHISFGINNQVTLDFLGKDSMRYYNTVEVDPEVYENLQLFVEGKNSSEDLFESINTSSLNDYLKSFMEGLSAKVFRTYNASFTLEQQLQKYNFEDKTVEEKIQNYTDANREVAILCNHQKSTPKNFEVQIEKMQDKLKSKLEYLNFLEKHLLHLQEKGEKVDPPEGQKPPASQEAARRAITRTQTTVKNMEIKLKMKDENKTVALGTSKINYMDPRITVAWCKRNEVPIEKVFPKTLRAKFIWAMYAEPEWSF